MKKHIRLYKQILRIKCKPNIETLDKEIINRCKSIRNIGKKIKIPERDLPATIIGAIYNRHYKIDESRTLNEPIDPSLKSKLTNKLGKIGTDNGINVIGRCAENQTANYLLLFKKAKKIENIKFTKAYRPRTARVIKRCNNCLNIFGQ
ncbi:hypothetical protein RT99_05390 [Flavobacterium sp. MEB061]|uniref:hypothetical protein n=1 Tax=Flavobacterium sp. MEB061 TaxID=1587524 RepID=UPI0005AC9CDA|nr:hypothetical protein [Flavobacterium sp. MEB061]KIQ22943.1 hypothetical protein RT99_05390 [Flavobacterium sp. MEB061]